LRPSGSLRVCLGGPNPATTGLRRSVRKGKIGRTNPHGSAKRGAEPPRRPLASHVGRCPFCALGPSWRRSAPC
jgi:hypothetical protein